MKKWIRKNIPANIWRPVYSVYDRLAVFFKSYAGGDYWGFAEYYNKNKACGKKGYQRIRFLITYLLFGASAEDYFLYRFYAKSFLEIDTFVTLRRRRWFTEKLNKNGSRYLVEDKAVFAEYFKEFTKREILDLKKNGREEFEQFVEKHGRVIAKPADGFDGKGIFLVNREDNLEEVFQRMAQSGYVVEQVVEQEGILHAMNPGTVNTLRVNVLQDKETIGVTTAIFRMGRGEGCADNFHQGGIATLVDTESGICTYQGVDIEGKRYVSHPSSGICFVGLKIPCWQEVVETVRKASVRIPDVHYLSWDVAVTGGGQNSVVIIEGNTYGNTDLQQAIDDVGKWKLYRDFTKRILKEERTKKSAG